MKTVRLTTAQALVRYLIAQRSEVAGREVPLFAGVSVTPCEGNIAALAEAFSNAREELPSWCAHNEQSMAHAAVAFARASRRQRMLVCVSSTGLGGTNLVTAAAKAHVNRLPVLLLPTDSFATRAPGPEVHQLESSGEPGLSINDCLRPVSRFFDRISRPEQLLSALPEAMRVLTDPAQCGPATLALAQDAQAEAFDFPEAFFQVRVYRPRRIRPDRQELAAAAQLLRWASRPLIIAGGGVHYSEAFGQLDAFARKHQIPVAETKSGRGALPWDHPFQVGALGVDGTSSANALAREADLVLCVGTRLSDTTTASRSMFQNTPVRFIGLNVAGFDAHKHGASPLLSDAAEGLLELSLALEEWKAPANWVALAHSESSAWRRVVETVTTAGPGLPTEAQVLGALNSHARSADVLVCAGGSPSRELHKLWRTASPGGCHLEPGHLCLGTEIASGLGVRLARPDAEEILVVLGDDGYLLSSSELCTGLGLGQKLVVILLDGHGVSRLRFLQQAWGSESSLPGREEANSPASSTVDFAQHALSLGARSEKLANLSELEAALQRARQADRTTVIVIDTDRTRATTEGGAWWDLPMPEVSSRATVQAARVAYVEMKRRQRLV